jgi:Spy/CpxP family protein refolding chaperone
MAIALLLVVALAGVGLGFAADRLALHNRRNEEPRTGPGFGGPPDGRRGGRGGDPRRGVGMRERFAQQLDLTPDQARRVDSIMTQQTADFRKLREQMQPRFDLLLAKAQAGIDSVLTSGQREKLRALRAHDAFGPRESFGARERRAPPFP